MQGNVEDALQKGKKGLSSGNKDGSLFEKEPRVTRTFMRTVAKNLQLAKIA